MKKTNKKAWYKKLRRVWAINPKTRVKPNRKKRRKDKSRIKKELKDRTNN